MLLVKYISNVTDFYKRNFDVYYCKKVEIRPQTYVNFIKAFQSMTLYGTGIPVYLWAVSQSTNCVILVCQSMILYGS